MKNAICVHKFKKTAVQKAWCQYTFLWNKPSVCGFGSSAPGPDTRPQNSALIMFNRTIIIHTNEKKIVCSLNFTRKRKTTLSITVYLFVWAVMLLKASRWTARKIAVYNTTLWNVPILWLWGDTLVIIVHIKWFYLTLSLL